MHSLKYVCQCDVWWLHGITEICFCNKLFRSLQYSLSKIFWLKLMGILNTKNTKIWPEISTIWPLFQPLQNLVINNENNNSVSSFIFFFHSLKNLLTISINWVETQYSLIIFTYFLFNFYLVIWWNTWIFLNFNCKSSFSLTASKNQLT